MLDHLLRFVMRTPHDVIIDVPVTSARVLAETGHVGLRARMEPVVLAIEAGLVLLRAHDRVRFAGSAGGLLSCDGIEATLFTPLGVTGDDAAAVRAVLDRALAGPEPEQKLRESLEKLEGRILTELRHESFTPPAPGTSVT